MIATVAVVCSLKDVMAANSRPTIYTYDLRITAGLAVGARWDYYHASVCLQGLANRQAPRLLLLDSSSEETWRNRLIETGGLCEGWPVQAVANFPALLNIFRSYVSGVILYDADPDTGVISTSLAATTAAGVENGLAVRKDTTAGSLYNYLVNDAAGPKLPVLVDLTGKFTGSGTIWQTTLSSSGSRKCDAYLWAKVRYLDTGACDPTVVSDSLDLWGLKYNDFVPALSNLDFAVAARGFCMELSPWGDEVPNDDPTQPLGTDLNTYKTILNACNQQTGRTAMIKFMGFPYFPLKYSSQVGGMHDPVPLEWETARLISAYNAYMEVFWTYNTSFYAALRPAMAERHFVQNPVPTYNQMVASGLINGSGQVVPGNYILANLGDYDCVSWTLNDVAITRYGDANRGQATCNWAIDPNLAWRVAPALDYVYRRKTDKDFFASWDSGAGYINPSMLYGSRSPSGYPSGVPIWQKHCRDWYRMLDYSISAWLLNGAQGSTNSTDFGNYQPFSGDGIGVYGSSTNMALFNNTPVKNAGSDLSDPNSSVINNATGVNFAWYRTVLWTPTQVKQLETNWSNSGHNHRFLDAFSFYYLMRYYLGGNNNHRATWVTDTIPRLMAAGQSYPVSVTVRNDGWDTWSEASQYRLSSAFVLNGDGADKGLVVDNDGLHGVVEQSGSVRLSAGKHPIEITYFEKTGGQQLEVRYAGPGIAKQLIPDSVLFRRSAAATAGLDYAYYQGTWDSLPNFDSLTPVKTGVLSNVSLSPATQGDFFGFRYRGYIQVPADGIYTFYTNSDDGSRLYIGGADFAPRYTLPANVAPGQSVTFSFNVTAPATAGRYDLFYDMVHESVSWFRAANNIEGKKEIIVSSNADAVDTDGDGLSDTFEQAAGLLYWHPDDAHFFQAGNPSPAVGEIHVAKDAMLSWAAAPNVTSHRVYFGETSPPPLVAEQPGTTFNPGLLAYSHTYYWRIDEISAFGTATGPVWTFTVRPLPGDFDLDGDVDQTDFARLQACFSGSGFSYAPGCGDADLNDDSSVSQADVQIFISCMAGEHRPPGC